MNFFRINEYLHCYDFPYYNYLKENEDYFNKIYEDKRPTIEQYNVSITGGEVYEFLNQKLLEIVFQHYYVSSYYSKHSIGVYKQTNKNSEKMPHNHIRSSSITAVFYLNPPKPKDGGGITFYYDNLNDSQTIHPTKESVYLFPSWVYHTPEPQISSTPRFSLNWGYMSNIRPIHKITGDYW
ncbi:MAG: 2OG-Fe(II) oxygenase [Fusobacterium sp.]